MKLTTLLLIFGLLNAHATGYSQTITFSGKNVSLVKVFAAVEEQTGYTFFANKDLLKSTRLVSVSVKDMSLKAFLDLAFRDQPVNYEINNKTIFIKRKTGYTVGGLTLQEAEDRKAEAPAWEKIKGTVTSVEGQPLEGATVSVKGTKTSVSSGANGNFEISAGLTQTLMISYVGYATLEEPINGRTIINIVLKTQSSEAEQVVVTALGIPKKTKALTYNVQEVKGDEVARVKDANFINSLAGKVAGVTINSSASGIGGSARVVMRGAKSLVGNNNALYVIDGVPLPYLNTVQPNDVFQGAGVTGDGISNINPEDIESISVLTGPAAAALYGSQAANGVVLVNTKRGAAGKFSLSVSNQTGFFSPFVVPKFQNTYGSDPQSYSSWGAKLDTAGSYDPKDFFQTGSNVTNSISLSAGNDKNQTYFSAGSVTARGIIPDNELTRYNFSVRNTSSFLNDKINLDLSLMYVNAKEQNMLSQGQYFNPLIPVYLFPRGDDIERYKLYERFNVTRNFKTQFWPFGDLGFQMQNPYWIVNRDFFNNNKDRYLMSSAVKYNIFSWLNIAGRVKLDKNNTVGEKKYAASTSGLFASASGAYYKTITATGQLYGDVIANINKNFYRDFNLNANIGASLTDTKYNLDSYGGNLLSVPNLFSFSNVNSALATATQDAYHDQTQGIFASAQVGYRNMIFLDASGRNDWSSALVNTNAKSIFYPSVGLSGVISDIAKLRSRIVSFVKLRGSYSEVGNSPQRFVTIATFPIIGGFPVTSSYLPATTLQPERTKSYEAGINLRFLRNKITLDVTAYKSSTFNQLFNPALAPSTGYSSFYVNAGQVDNKGIEAALGFNGKIAGGLQWSSTATFTLNRNKIVQLLSSYTDKTTSQTVSVDSLSVGGTGSYMMALVKNGSIGDIYVTSLKTDEHGLINVGLQTQTVIADPNTYIKAGNASPRYNIGFRNGFTYKNIEMNFLVSARIGGVGVSITQAIMDRFGVSATSAQARDNGGVLVNGYRIPADSYYAVAGGGVAGVGSLYTYSATNVRLGEATLSYTFTGHMFNNKIKGITVSAIGRNLFMFYNKAPFDPESTANTGTYYQGIDYFMQPSLRSIGFSARVQF